MVTAGLTAFYMFRSYFMTFEGECRADAETQAHIHESPWTMTVPLIVLAVLAFAGGYVGVPHVLGGPWHPVLDLHGFLYQAVGHGEALFVNRFGGYTMAIVGMGVAICIAIGGAGTAWMFYGSPSDFPAKIVQALGRVYTLVANKYYVDELYDALIVRPLRWTGIVCHQIVDVFLIDQVLVQGTASVAEFGGSVLKQFQNGDVQRYAAFIVFGVALIVLLLL
jgi:NADH-quinone oxidoreductase subunit L